MLLMSRVEARHRANLGEGTMNILLLLPLMLIAGFALVVARSLWPE